MTQAEKDRLSEALTLFFCGMCAGFIVGWSVHKDYFTPKDEAKEAVIDTAKATYPVAMDSTRTGWIKVAIAVEGGSARNDIGTGALEGSARNDLATAALKDSTQDGPKGRPAYTSDTAIYLPRTQKRYGDSTYTAWVSGYEPRLDSIQTYRRTVTITKRQTVTKRNAFSMGIVGGAGYGLLSRKPDVWIGIGGALRLW